MADSFVIDPETLRQREHLRLRAQVEKERRRRQTAELAETCRASLAEFVRQAWPIIEPSTPLRWNWHLDAICTHLEAVAHGVIRNLICNVPPGSSKSTVASAMWPAWMWVRNPGWRLLSASHKLDLASRDAVKSRAILESDWFRETFQPAWDWETVQSTYYKNSAWGHRLALSVGSGVTGHRADTLLCDDPLDAQDAESEYERQICLAWWKNTFANRLNDLGSGSRVVIMQRLHAEDMTGYLLDQGGWDLLRLPAEFEADTPCVTSIGWTDPRTTDGELLDPLRLSQEVLDIERNRLGEYGFAGQFQQRPVSKSGGLFDVSAETLKMILVESVPP